MHRTTACEVREEIAFIEGNDAVAFIGVIVIVQDVFVAEYRVRSVYINHGLTCIWHQTAFSLAHHTDGAWIWLI